MNETMRKMMKPIPAENKSISLRQRQEEHVLNWLRIVDYSVDCWDVANRCHDIPGIKVDRCGNARMYERRQCSYILQRLERKGHVISVLYGQCRYYSIPVNGGEQ